MQSETRHINVCRPELYQQSILVKAKISLAEQLQEHIRPALKLLLAYIQQSALVLHPPNPHHKIFSNAVVPLIIELFLIIF